MTRSDQIHAGLGDDQLLSFEYLNPEGRRLLRKRFEAQAVNDRLDISWLSVPYNRIALVNHIAARKPAARYLEIGCAGDQLFHAVPLADKTGVDPVKGGTHRMTSDAFFAANASTFDIVFVDGLHTHDQVRRDIENAIAVLAPGGWIAIHDLVPRTWDEEHVPRVAPGWTGDVWKVGVELARTPGLSFQLVMIDHGVGLVRLDGSTEPTLADMREELQDARFERFLQEFPDLPKISWAEAVAWVDACEWANGGVQP
jgi:SAM-dependent methyltransferase